MCVANHVSAPVVIEMHKMNCDCDCDYVGVGVGVDVDVGVVLY